MDRSSLKWGPLYLIAGDSSAGDADFLGRVRDALEGGVDVVQLREKSRSDEDLLRRGEALRDLCAERGIPFVMNDRADLAHLLSADGVHVGQSDLAPVRVREIVGDNCVIGLSTHDRGQVEAAHRDAAVDLIGIGPVFPTQTKDAGPALGVAVAVAAAMAFDRGPSYAIGGIDVAGAGALGAAGHRRIAVASAILGASDCAAAAATLREELRRDRRRESP